MAVESEPQCDPEPQPAKRRRRLRPLFKEGEDFEAPWAANQVALVATPSKKASAAREEPAAGSVPEQPVLLTDNISSLAASAKAASKGSAAAKASARAEAKAAAKAAAPAEATAKDSARAEAKATAKAAAQAKTAAKAAARAEAKAKAKAKTKAKARQVGQSRGATLGTAATNPASGLSDAAVAAAETPRVEGEAADLAPEASVARTNASEEVKVAQYTPYLKISGTSRAASEEKHKNTRDHYGLNAESENFNGRAALEQLISDCAAEGKPSQTMRASMGEDATVSINSATFKAAEMLHTQAISDAVIRSDANESSMGASTDVAGAKCEASAHIVQTNDAGSVTPRPSETHLVTEIGKAPNDVQSPIPAANTALSKAVHTAKERVVQLSQAQGTVCMRLQNALQGEFDLATRSKACACKVRQEIESVFAAGARADVAALTNAMDLANAQGLPMGDTMAESLLGKLRKEEELEGIWRCLASSLEAADRVAIVFWCDEATQLGVTVPPEIGLALNDLKGEETAILARWESEASLASLATEAFHRRDIEALQDLVQQAQRAGSDPSAALAALAALTGDLQEDGAESAGITGTAGPSCSSFSCQAQSSKDDEPEEEELERLYVSSPNGQAHCFGMYVLVRQEKPNGMPVWRQLGGERWLYADKNGRWSIGSNKVRERNFDCSAGFIFCPEPHRGIMPHEMKVWCRWDEVKNKWAKDDDITVASEYVEEVIEPRRKRAAGRGAKQGKTRGGRAGRGRGEGQPKASGRQSRQAAQQQQQPPGSAPPRAASSGTRFPQSQQPPPSFLPSAAGVGKAKALRVLGFSAAQSVNAEDLRKAYRQQALRWHPDRPQNHGSEQDAKRKFLEVREAFEFMQACLEPMRFLQAGSSGGL
eukprot:TRINITY_DN8726_c0_g1_i1.p1 TRINITY_DN8726_c0_g1~~TRINITY_DN8726_c0_g1_i1.p1  ORF type:complete len:895 (+),score=231.02 TRINITY_DN8726_c0_g1_i1:33-2687(+)